MDAKDLVDRLRRDGLRIAVAESCTGGLIQTAIVDIPGASEVFVGGVVVYNDDFKSGLLGIDSALITKHGSVSGTVAEAMARAVREKAGSDLAVAVTGIAGPTGGTTAKPVGTVWVAALGPGEDLNVHRFVFKGNRGAIRTSAVKAALQLVMGEIDEWAQETRS
jgi:nicotinamide-nucleotide amidase